MGEEGSFLLLMEQLRQGDQEAARRIFHEYSHRLIGLARSRLDRQVLQKEGAEDVVQSALMSFFRRHAAEPFHLTNWSNLWALLTVITLRKCGHRIEYYRALCRNVSRETPMATSDDSSTASWMAIAREPSPEEATTLRDTLGDLMRGLDDRERQMVHLALEHYTVPEISRQVSRSEYFVRKVLDQVRRRWERLCDE